MSETTKVDWNTNKDLYLLELLSTQCLILRKPANGLTRDAWKTIIEEFTKKYEAIYKNDELQNRMKMLREYYKTMTYLLNYSSDFGWDPLQNMITASEDVWDAMIVAKPSVRVFRDKVFPPYKSLATVFGEGIADSRASQTGSDLLEAIGTRVLDSQGDPTPEHIESSGSNGETRSQPPAKRSRSNTRGSNSKGSKGSKGSKNKQLNAVDEAIVRIASALEVFSQAAVRSSHVPVREVMTALDETPGLSEADYHRAVSLFAENPCFADYWVLMTPARRLFFILEKLK